MIRRVKAQGKVPGLYKASLTVEASFVMIICMAVLLALFLLMFMVYHENIDFYNNKMNSYEFDSVKAFRVSQVFKNLIK